MTLGLIPGWSANIFLTILITIVLEIIIYFIWFRRDFGNVALYGFLINLFTVPLANYIFSELILGARNLGFLLIEVGVIIVETYLIYLLFKTKIWKAAILSFIANIFSAIVGLLIVIWLYMI